MMTARESEMLGSVTAVRRPDTPADALVGNQAWARVIRQARCTDSSLDADEWFPISPGAQEARREAAAAIALCRACPVRSQCLAISLRHWDIGQHGVWGGMVAAERASLRRQMLGDRADAPRLPTRLATLT
jgi:Transcription factor WhiB